MKLATATHPSCPQPFPALLLSGETALNLARAAQLADTGRPASDYASLAGIIAAEAASPGGLRHLRAEAEAGRLDEACVDAAGLRLLAPLPRPAKNVFCVGRNYLDHVSEGYKAQKLEIKVPEHIQFFSKPPTAVIGPDASIECDPAVTGKLDYEVELGIVIGKGGKNISADQALSHVFGYTIVNDITARDLQRAHDQWFKGKGLDRSCPMGPWIVTADEVAAPQDIRLSLSVNGEPRQDASTAQMIFKLPAIIAELSKGLTLEPGDIIATGTPSGVGYAMDPPRFLRPGDVIRCEIEGIGVLSNRVAAPDDITSEEA